MTRASRLYRRNANAPHTPRATSDDTSYSIDDVSAARLEDGLQNKDPFLARSTAMKNRASYPLRERHARSLEHSE